MTRTSLLMFFILLVVSINSAYDPNFNSLPKQPWSRNFSASPRAKRPTARSSGRVAASPVVCAGGGRAWSRGSRACSSFA